MYDAYDAYDNNEIANEREAHAIWQEHIRRHEDGTTHVPNTIASLCETVEELRRENEELREGIRRERTDSEISFETAEQYMKERDEALDEVAKLRNRVMALTMQREEMRHHMQAGLGTLVSNAVARMYERLEAQDAPNDLLHAVTIDIDRLPANRAA